MGNLLDIAIEYLGGIDMENRFDVIVIGAGPGGIFCAYELMDKKKDLKVLVVEKGRSIEKRNCPKRVTKQCVGCKPCSITAIFRRFWDMRRRWG